MCLCHKAKWSSEYIVHDLDHHYCIYMCLELLIRWKKNIYDSGMTSFCRNVTSAPSKVLMLRTQVWVGSFEMWVICTECKVVCLTVQYLSSSSFVYVLMFYGRLLWYTIFMTSVRAVEHLKQSHLTLSWLWCNLWFTIVAKFTICEIRLMLIAIVHVLALNVSHFQV